MKQLLLILLSITLCLSFTVAYADTLVYEEDYPIGTVHGDAVSGMPALAPRGEYAIGVRTIEIVNPNQVDLAAITEENPRPLHDRKLTVEVWYPGVVAEGARQISTYTDYIGRIDTNDLEAFDYVGRAMRDAELYAEAGPYPVIIVTHGFPGNRYLMSYLGENLATKGYVVFALEHTDATYLDFNPAIALLSANINRSADQRFMIDCLDTLNAEGWLAGALDAEHVGVIGYSYGGYGLLRTLGVKVSQAALERYAAYADLLTDPEEYQGDKRVDAAVLLAPYGAALLDAETCANITTPTLWMQGDADTVAPHAPVLNWFSKSVNSDRYFVIYENLNHSVAPNPVPPEVQKRNFVDARRWADAVWDISRVNGYNLHFITAFMDAKLKGDEAKMDYLNVKEPIGKNCVYSIGADGVPTDQHTYWPGFISSTTVGLIIQHAAAQ